ncbi:ABC transporter substrate-binding protein [Hyphomicrobium sp. 802]|uniref:ABC transporter substrate-binding protein n=1 Tax=Hyphomicrobium sp. 802 TaxID=1112272 RepID=UPI0009DD91BB|nr:ABC transporter substrate-binding protein [Hyphomicrobium sp. 802]
MFSSNRPVLWFFASALAALLWGPGASAAFEAAAAATPAKVRVALTPGISCIAIAKQEGFFSRQGLDVEFIGLATGSETIAAVQGGSADLAYADTFAGVNAIHNGFKIVLTAGANVTSPAVNYLVRSDSDIHGPGDLTGRTLGIGGVPFFRVFAHEFLKSYKVNPADVKFTIVKQWTALPEALANGSIDAIQSFGYEVSYLNSGQGNGYNFRTIADPSTSKYQNAHAVQAGWWTSAAWAADNKDALHRFADAFRQFAGWFNRLDANRRSVLALKFNHIDYVALAGGDAVKLTNLALLSMPIYVEGPIDVSATQQWIDTGVSVAPGQVSAGVNISEHLWPTAN